MNNRKFHQTRPFKLLLVLFTLTLNILWFVKTDWFGGESGAQAIINDSILAYIVLQLIFLYFLAGSIYFLIKDV